MKQQNTLENERTFIIIDKQTEQSLNNGHGNDKTLVNFKRTRSFQLLFVACRTRFYREDLHKKH